MSVSEYATAFTKKMKSVSQLIPTETSEVERFANGLPTDFILMVKLATTLETDIRISKSLEDMINGRTTTQAKVGKKKINKAS